VFYTTASMKPFGISDPISHRSYNDLAIKMYSVVKHVYSLPDVDDEWSCYSSSHDYTSSVVLPGILDLWLLKDISNIVVFTHSDLQECVNKKKGSRFNYYLVKITGYLHEQERHL
jgi:hypothetical protein